MTKLKTKQKPVLVNKLNGGGLPFKIESGIPLATRKKPNPYQDLFMKMKNGDSFLIGNNEEVAGKLQYYASKWGSENDATFAFRITDDGKRCWRIK